MNIKDRLRLSPYAPVRYQKEPWWIYSESAARAEWILRDGRVSMHLTERIFNDLVVPTMRAGMEDLSREFQDPVELGHVTGEIYARLAELRHWVPLAGQFIKCGRQIFDLTDEVVDMLEQTDFGDCTLEGWHPPYDALYIHFGKRDDIRLPWEDDFEYLDGAFVAMTPYDDQGNLRLKLGFTTCKKDGQGVMLPGYFLDFLPEEQTMPVAQAIEHAIARRASLFSDQVDSSEDAKALNAHRRDHINEAGEILKQASSLIVNVLFYLESVNTQRRQEPGRDTPTEYTVRWERSDSRQREKLKSKLLANGYTAVYLLGREFASSKTVAQGGHRRTHWRRGHWRRQHHGQANTLIKRIWIKPQIISAGSGDDLTGHVYVVGNTDTPNTRH